MLKCGKPYKSFVSKVMNWCIWVVTYRETETSVIQAETFGKRKDAYNFYKTLKGAKNEDF